MFGLTVFSQSPFAALGGNQYALAIAEAVTMAELESAVAAYLASISEAITVGNTDSEQDAFFAGIVETLTQADSSTQASAFLQSDT